MYLQCYYHRVHLCNSRPSFPGTFLSQGTVTSCHRLFRMLFMGCLVPFPLQGKVYLYVIMWPATVVCKTNLIAQDTCSTLCACVIKGSTGVSNTHESSVNSTPHLGKLGGGADINKYNEGLLLSNERLESYTRSPNWIIGTTKGQSKSPG